MNGYIYKKDRLKMTSLTVVYDAGSELETPGRYGTMHLMEHLICKTIKDLYPVFTANGIEWNGYTTENKITVWFEGLVSRLTSGMKLKILGKLTGGLDMVGEDEFSTEKTVVIQEYFDSVVDDTQANYLNMMRRYWNDYCPIGRFEDIKAFGYNDMFETYDRYFRCPSRIIEIGPEKTPELEKYVKPPAKTAGHRKPVFGNYENPMIEEKSLVKTPVYMLFPKTVSKKDYPFVKTGLSMLTDGMESPYYEEIRVKNGLSYYVMGHVEKNVEGGKMLVCACTDKANGDALRDKMSECSTRLYDHLSEERFNTVMEGMRVKREKENILKYAYTGKYSNISKLKMPSDLNKISLEEVRYVMSRYFADMIVVKGTDF